MLILWMWIPWMIWHNFSIIPLVLTGLLSESAALFCWASYADFQTQGICLPICRIHACTSFFFFRWIFCSGNVRTAYTLHIWTLCSLWKGHYTMSFTLTISSMNTTWHPWTSFFWLILHFWSNGKDKRHQLVILCLIFLVWCWDQLRICNIGS